MKTIIQKQQKNQTDRPKSLEVHSRQWDRHRERERESQWKEVKERIQRNTRSNHQESSDSFKISIENQESTTPNESNEQIKEG